jgi:hypothetical protein
MESAACASLFAVFLAASAPAARAAPDEAAGLSAQDLSREDADRAASALDNGDAAEAARLAQEAIARLPGNARAHNLLAGALNRQGAYSKAEAAAVRGISAVPAGHSSGLAPLYENLAFAQLHLGKAFEAGQNAGKAIEFSQDTSARAYALRAFSAESLEAQAAAKGARSEQARYAREKLSDIRRAAAMSPDEFGERAAAVDRGERIFVQESPGFADRFPALAALSGAPEAWAGLALLLLVCLGCAVTLWARREEPAPVALRAAAPLLARPADGLLAGRYELVRVIGKGGMGEVLEAKDASLRRTVAIKRMTAALEALGPQAKDYYLKEAKTLASLHHPAIVDIYEVLDLPDGMHLVFEFVAGKTVQQVLVEEKRLSLTRVKEILRPACEALEYAHARGIVHRDLKPSNIMLTNQGFVKVMDFGIARRNAEAVQAPGLPVAGPGILKTQTIIGTPAYMSPEAVQGVVSAGTDVFALGVCLYEMLTGELPFGMEGQAATGVYVAASRLVPGVAPEADALIAAALRPALEERIPTVREFLTRLQALPEARVGV